MPRRSRQGEGGLRCEKASDAKTDTRFSTPGQFGGTGSNSPATRYLRGRLPGYRANEFRERCRGLGIHGVSLHSYRYAWAERAKTAGYPERFAQLALGHNSKAVHRAYASKAQVTLPPLEDYEKTAAAAPLIPPPVSGTG